MDGYSPIDKKEIQSANLFVVVVSVVALVMFAFIPEEIATIAIITTLGIAFTYTGFVLAHGQKRLLSNNVTRIKNTQPGEAQISADVIYDGKTRLTAPLSGKACVFYRVTLEKKVPDPVGNGTIWEPFASYNGSDVFLVKDGSGTACLDAGNARIAFHSAYKKTLPITHEHVQHVAHLGKINLKREHVNEVRVVEYIIREGDKLFVTGIASKEKKQRTRKAAQLYMTGSSNRYPLLIYGGADASLNRRIALDLSLFLIPGLIMLISSLSVYAQLIF